MLRGRIMTNSHDKGSISDFSKRAAIVAFFALLAGSAAYFVWIVGHGILVAFAAALFAVMLDGLARLITRVARLPRAWSVGCAALLVGFVLIGGISLGGARVAQQAPQLSQTLQKELNQLQHKLKQEGFHPSKVLGNGSDKSFSLGKQVFSHFSNFIAVPLGIVTDLVIVMVAGLYFAVRPRFYLDSAVRIFPPQKRKRIHEVIYEVGHALRRWLAGRFIAMLVIGILITIGLAVMGVKLAFLLGFIAGILTFVPYLGAVISAIPAILVALLHGPLTAVYVAGLFLAAHILEGYILIPWIQERQVSMAPAYLILAQLLGGLIAGALGVLLATPMAVSITIAIQMLYLQDVLGEQVHILGEKQ